MSFDLTIAPTPLTDLMNRVFMKYFDLSVIVFTEDILINLGIRKNMKSFKSCSANTKR